MSRNRSQNSWFGPRANLTLEAAFILACSKADSTFTRKDPLHRCT